MPQTEAGEAAAAATSGGDGGGTDEADAGDALDFSKMISSEVKDLKDVKKQPFVVHDTGVKTCMFVGMPLVSESTPGPCEVRLAVLCFMPHPSFAHLLQCASRAPVYTLSALTNQSTAAWRHRHLCPPPQLAPDPRATCHR